MRGLDIVGVPAPNIQTVIQSPGFAFFPVLQEFSAGVTVTADATIHTKGAWTELIAATANEATWVCVTVTASGGAGLDSAALLDIGVGAAASETVAIPNLPAGFTGSTVPVVAYIPLLVPKGTRVSARFQSIITVRTATVTVSMMRGQRVGITATPKVDTYGANTAASRGVNMPTSDTYVEVTAGLTRPCRALIALPCGGTGTNFAAESSTYTMAIGASGAEVPVATMSVSTTSTEGISPTATVGFGGIAVGHFPAGTRVACKQATGRNYRDVIVIGVPYA